MIATVLEQQALNGTPSFTVLYPGPENKYFDLSSIYFGYALHPVEGAVDTAVQCTIEVAGFRKRHEVALAAFTFTPPIVHTSASMIKAALPSSLVALQEITLIQGNPAAQF